MTTPDPARRPPSLGIMLAVTFVVWLIVFAPIAALGFDLLHPRRFDANYPALLACGAAVGLFVLRFIWQFVRWFMTGENDE